jgi:CRISPR-associated endoribonuclease Cas6
LEDIFILSFYYFIVIFNNIPTVVRIRIIFILKNKGGYVPFHHQFLLAEVKEKILSDNKKYDGFTDYNFSGLKGQTKISKNGLHFYSSRVTLVLSSPDQNFIDHFLQSLFDLKELLIGNLQLVPEGVEQEILPVFSDSMKCICISPVVLVDSASGSPYVKKFVSPDSDVFSDLLYESTIDRMEKTGTYTSEQIASFYKFQIVPDKNYLEKIKEGEKKFARIYPVYTPADKYEVRGYTFPFSLYAAPQVQEFLFNYGLGVYTHKGFGMLDIANADLTRKTETYHFLTVDR